MITKTRARATKKIDVVKTYFEQHQPHDIEKTNTHQSTITSLNTKKTNIIIVKPTLVIILQQQTLTIYSKISNIIYTNIWIHII